MKKLIAIPVALLLTSATMQTHAQGNEDMVKNEIKDTKVDAGYAKKEKREERKTLRELEGKEVSDAAKANFATDFQNVSNVQWQRSTQFDEATFTKDGEAMTAYYDYNSNLIGTTQNRSFEDLSAVAQKKIKENYKGYNVSEVIFFDDNEANETDMIFDDIQFDDEDIYFVALKKDAKKIIVMVNNADDISYFTTIK